MLFCKIIAEGDIIHHIKDETLVGAWPWLEQFISIIPFRAIKQSGYRSHETNEPVVLHFYYVRKNEKHEEWGCMSR